MIRNILGPALAIALLGGCVSAGYGYRGGAGDYYYGRAGVETRYYGPGYGYGGYYGDPAYFGYAPYGYSSWGYWSYGAPYYWPYYRTYYGPYGGRVGHPYRPPHRPDRERHGQDWYRGSQVPGQGGPPGRENRHWDGGTRMPARPAAEPSLRRSVVPSSAFPTGRPMRVRPVTPPPAPRSSTAPSSRASPAPLRRSGSARPSARPAIAPKRDRRRIQEH